MPSALAFRYARALADLAAKPGERAEASAIAGELESFENALKESVPLKNALESPAVPPAKKHRVVATLAKRLALSNLTMRFLYVLVDHRRVPLLPEVREAFEAVLNERLGIVQVEISSARELTAGQRSQLIEELTRLTGKQARAHFQIREDLIGGVVARIGSTVYDGSIRGQLMAIKHRLAGAGS
jgi:F-type H+-transporting ATPase subunit delta